MKGRLAPPAAALLLRIPSNPSQIAACCYSPYCPGCPHIFNQWFRQLINLLLEIHFGLGELISTAFSLAQEGQLLVLVEPWQVMRYSSLHHRQFQNTYHIILLEFVMFRASPFENFTILLLLCKHFVSYKYSLKSYSYVYISSLNFVN